MKYAARMNKSTNLDCYGKVLYHFERKFLNANNIDEDADDWFHNLGEYVDDTKFPCDKIVLDPFCGYSDIFMLLFKYNDQDVCWVKVKVHSNGMMTIHNYDYKKKDFEIFHNIIKGYFKEYNKHILEDIAYNANVSLTKDNNVVVVEYYQDYNKVVDNATNTLQGTLKQIFDQYAAYQDTFKYINGKYMKFANKNVEKLWKAFLIDYDGNFFLDNAVKRGCLID